MEKIAKVAVSAATFSIDKPYDYLISEDLIDSVKVGVRVTLPFGRGNRVSEGVVLSIVDGERTEKLKYIRSVLDAETVMSENEIRLALWMRSRYFCTFYDAIKTILPVGLWYEMRTVYHFHDGVDYENASKKAEDISGAQNVLDVLLAHKGSADIEHIKAACDEKAPKILKALCERELLCMETTAMRNVKDSQTKIVEIAVPVEEAMDAAEKKKRTAPMRYEAIKLLCTAGSMTATELCYYTGTSMKTLKNLEKDGVIILRSEEKLRIDQRENREHGAPVVLNEEQQAAFEGISQLMYDNAPNAALLYGVTGSGKTLVYIKLIEKILRSNKAAIVLVPEIALTPQIMDKFTAYFGQQVVMLHSGLRMTERYDQWKRIKRGDVKVVLGTRSAIFAPLQNIGLIILDEEQEGTYQSENLPRYHAKEVAKYLCSVNQATLVLGSATPAVESAYYAKNGVYKEFLLKNRYNKRALPNVLIVDMKKELKQGNPGIVSQTLQNEIQKNIQEGQQSILFLNRRGNSRMIVCGECGAVPECPRCSVPLTYHSANNRLMCHYCGFSQKAYKRCPDCDGLIKHVGTGTQKVEEELHELFPDTEILRMDADTVSAKMGHEKILSRFEKEKIPILLGTQMVTKGLDFENVTLVGVLAADLSLYVDNFRAAERTFSLLTQVIGRAGRGDKIGRAIIQTYTPDNEVIRSAQQQDYDGFYETEIKMRKYRLYPPFSDLFTFVVSGMEEGQVLRGSSLLRNAMKDAVAKGGEDIEIIGPAPAPILKVNNRYRYHLTLIAKNTQKTREFIFYFMKAFYAERDNRGLNIFVDCNAIN